jgi:flagellar motor switch protein FliG
VSKPSNSKWSQTEKVAILLLSLGEDMASELIQKLPKAEAQRVLQTIAKIRQVDQETITQIQGEFKSLLQSFKQPTVDGADAARRIISKAFSAEDGAKFSAALPRQIPQSFRDAELIDGKALWQILSKEHPQTIALILGHLSAKKSGELAGQMPSEVRAEVLSRLANLNEIDPSVLDVVDEVLSKAIEQAKQRGTQRVGGPRKTAEILTHLSAAQRQALLSDIENRSPELAAEVKAGMFTFDDLRKLDRKAFETLLKVIPQTDLETAMRRCDDVIASLFYAAMSSRRAEQFKENLAAGKPMSVSKIEDAQRKIAATAAELIAKGEIRDPLDEAV